MPINVLDIKRAWSNYGALRYVKGKGWYAHAGVDAPCRLGAEYIAPVRVKVTKVIYLASSYGYRIEIAVQEGAFFYGIRARDNLRFSLSHCLKRPKHKRGDIVRPMDQIAQVGSTGNSEAPHMHLESGVNLGFNGYAARSEETSLRGFIDPVSIFDFEGVRWG